MRRDRSSRRALRVAVTVVALLGIALAAASLAGAKGKAKHVVFPSNCSSGKYKPKSVVVTCGDAAFYVKGITWSKWSRKSAAGSGTAHVNSCTPDCATGTFGTYPVNLKLGKRRNCKSAHKQQFTRLSFNFPGSHPSGVTKGSDPFPCPVIVCGNSATVGKRVSPRCTGPVAERRH